MKKLNLLSISAVLFALGTTVFAASTYNFTLINHTLCPVKVMFNGNTTDVDTGSSYSAPVVASQQLAFYTNGILTDRTTCTTNGGAGVGYAMFYFDNDESAYIENVQLSDISPDYNVDYNANIVFDNNSHSQLLQAGSAIKHQTTLGNNSITITLKAQ